MIFLHKIHGCSQAYTRGGCTITKRMKEVLTGVIPSKIPLTNAQELIRQVVLLNHHTLKLYLEHIWIYKVLSLLFTMLIKKTKLRNSRARINQKHKNSQLKTIIFKLYSLLKLPNIPQWWIVPSLPTMNTFNKQSIPPKKTISSSVKTTLRSEKRTSLFLSNILTSSLMLKLPPKILSLLLEPLLLLLL